MIYPQGSSINDLYRTALGGSTDVRMVSQTTQYQDPMVQQSEIWLALLKLACADIPPSINIRIGSKYILDSIEEKYNELQKRTGSFSSEFPLYEDPVKVQASDLELYVALNINLFDCFEQEHKISKVIVISGASGPATLAGCQAYIADPKKFEPTENDRKNF